MPRYSEAYIAGLAQGLSPSVDLGTMRGKTAAEILEVALDLCSRTLQYDQCGYYAIYGTYLRTLAAKSSTAREHLLTLISTRRAPTQTLTTESVDAADNALLHLDQGSSGAVRALNELSASSTAASSEVDYHIVINAVRSIQLALVEFETALNALTRSRTAWEAADVAFATRRRVVQSVDDAVRANVRPDGTATKDLSAIAAVSASVVEESAVDIDLDAPKGTDLVAVGPFKMEGSTFPLHSLSTDSAELQYSCEPGNTVTISSPAAIRAMATTTSVYGADLAAPFSGIHSINAPGGKGPYVRTLREHVVPGSLVLHVANDHITDDGTGNLVSVSGWPLDISSGIDYTSGKVTIAYADLTVPGTDQELPVGTQFHFSYRKYLVTDESPFYTVTVAAGNSIYHTVIFAPPVKYNLSELATEISNFTASVDCVHTTGGNLLFTYDTAGSAARMGIPMGSTTPVLSTAVDGVTWITPPTTLNDLLTTVPVEGYGVDVWFNDLTITNPAALDIVPTQNTQYRSPPAAATITAAGASLIDVADGTQAAFLHVLTPYDGYHQVVSANPTQVTLLTPIVLPLDVLGVAGSVDITFALETTELVIDSNQLFELVPGGGPGPEFGLPDEAFATQPRYSYTASGPRYRIRAGDYAVGPLGGWAEVRSSMGGVVTLAAYAEAGAAIYGAGPTTTPVTASYLRGTLRTVRKLLADQRYAPGLQHPLNGVSPDAWAYVRSTLMLIFDGIASASSSYSAAAPQELADLSNALHQANLSWVHTKLMALEWSVFGLTEPTSLTDTDSVEALLAAAMRTYGSEPAASSSLGTSLMSDYIAEIDDA